MISWEFTVALVIVAFVLPCIVLYFNMEKLRQQRRNDATEKEYLRRMLRETEAHVRNDKSLFLEALGVPFLLVKPSGRLVMANHPAGELLGVDVQKCPNLLKILPEGTLLTLLQEVLQEQHPSTPNNSPAG